MTEIMETTNDKTATLSAERSIEIIYKNIEQSRKDASKSMGDSLLVIGLLIIGMAVVVGIINYATFSYWGHFLWLTIPLILWGMQRIGWINAHKSPTSIIDGMIRKTWRTFVQMVTAFFIFSTIFNNVLLRYEDVEVYSRVHIHILPIILLLMGMVITMIGHILKNRWMIALGIIGGVNGFVSDAIQLSVIVFTTMGFPIENLGRLYTIRPCIEIALFCLVGLILPSIILKRK